MERKGKMQSGDLLLDQLLAWNANRVKAIEDNKAAGNLPFGSSPSSVDIQQKQQAEALRQAPMIDKAAQQNIRPPMPQDSSTSIYDAPQRPPELAPENMVTPPAAPPPEMGAPPPGVAAGPGPQPQQVTSKLDMMVEKLSNTDPGHYADALRGNERMGMIMKLMGNDTFSSAGDSLMGMEQNRRVLEKGMADSSTQREQFGQELEVKKGANAAAYAKARATARGKWKETKDTMTNGDIYSHWTNTTTMEQTQPELVSEALGSHLETAQREEFVNSQMDRAGIQSSIQNMTRLEQLFGTPGRDINTGMFEMLQQMGVNILPFTTDAYNDTEEFRQIMAGEIIQVVKKLGANPSNTDLKFIQSGYPSNWSDEDAVLNWVRKTKNALVRHDTIAREEGERQRPYSPTERTNRIIALIERDEDPAYKDELLAGMRGLHSSQSDQFTRKAASTVEPSGMAKYRDQQGPTL